MNIRGKEAHIKYDYLRQVALRGSNMSGCHQRIKEYFLKHRSLNERSTFLQNEYGIGGYGSPCHTPFSVHHLDFRSSGISVGYTDGAGIDHEKNISYSELAKEIDKLIEEGVYGGRCND